MGDGKTKKYYRVGILLEGDDRSMKPIRATPGSVGYDVKCATAMALDPGQITAVPLGFCLQLPPNMYAEIKGRSGKALDGIWTHVGTIDSDYRGSVKAILYNTTDSVVHIKQGERVAQMILHEIPPVEFEEVDVLSNTSRNLGGFGSTGI